MGNSHGRCGQRLVRRAHGQWQVGLHVRKLPELWRQHQHSDGQVCQRRLRQSAFRPVHGLCSDHARDHRYADHRGQRQRRVGLYRRECERHDRLRLYVRNISEPRTGNHGRCFHKEWRPGECALRAGFFLWQHRLSGLRYKDDHPAQGQRLVHDFCKRADGLHVHQLYLRLRLDCGQ